jgi:hypothetical protein
MTTIYIAGPMTNVNNHNFPLFDHVAEVLRTAGYFVVSPAEHARKVLGSLQTIQKMDKAELEEAVRTKLMPTQLAWICSDADAMVMLPGWQQSLGAKAEHALAQWRKIPIYECPDVVLVDEQWLTPLQRLISVKK